MARLVKRTKMDNVPVLAKVARLAWKAGFPELHRMARMTQMPEMPKWPKSLE